jgi:hypothetical protein
MESFEMNLFQTSEVVDVTLLENLLCPFEKSD